MNAQEDIDKQTPLRAARDLVERLRPGTYIYPMVWPIVYLGVEDIARYQVLFWSGLIGLAATGFWRYRVMSELTRENEGTLNKWTLKLRLSSALQSLVWGLLFAYSLLLDSNELVLYMTLSSAGIAAGGTNSFAPDGFLRRTFLLTLIGPALLVCVFITHQWILVALFMFYITYMLNVARRQSNEYWRSLNNEMILSKQSRTDPLTQLDNRRFFDEKLNEFCLLSTRNHDQLSVLLVDCDHFKKVNDNYGHDVGDVCLKHLSAILQQAVPRATDVVARYGGEEFSIILPGTNHAGAIKVAERIRKQVEVTPMLHGKINLKITVSIGGVSTQLLEEFISGLPNRLFKQADKALYKAKNEGRNCSIVEVLNIDNN